jgi:hypothetical protein
MRSLDFTTVLLMLLFAVTGEQTAATLQVSWSRVRTPSQSRMRLVMARFAALVACCQFLSLCPAKVVNICWAQGPWLPLSSWI